MISFFLVKEQIYAILMMKIQYIAVNHFKRRKV